MLRLACLCCLLLLSEAAFGQTRKGIYVGSFDGDQVKAKVMVRGRTVVRAYRLAGIDAPEVRGHQPGWQAARDALRTRLARQVVDIELRGYDTKWKRQLAIVRIDGRDIGFELVVTGQAWFYKNYSRSLTARERIIYEAAQAKAQADKAGVWAAKRQIAPWQWRRGKR